MSKNLPTTLADALQWSGPEPERMPQPVALGESISNAHQAEHDAWMNRTVDVALDQLIEKTAHRLAGLKLAREMLTPEVAKMKFRDVQALYHAL